MNEVDSKRKRSADNEQGASRLEEALAIVETLMPDELAKLAEKVTVLRKTLPMQLSNVPTSMEGMFTIYEKGFIKEASEFKYFVDTVRSFKLVWENGEEMDLKLVNYSGFIAAGSMMAEVQGMRVGPLLITASFPETDRLPNNSSAEDLEEGVAELIQVCKKHGVEFGDIEEFTSFVDWLMQDIMDGSTQFLYNIVIDGALGDAYENVTSGADSTA